MQYVFFDQESFEVMGVCDRGALDFSGKDGAGILLDIEILPTADETGVPVPKAVIPENVLDQAAATAGAVVKDEQARLLEALSGEYPPAVRDAWPLFLELADQLVSSDLKVQNHAIQALAYCVPDCEAASAGINPDTPEARASYFANRIREKSRAFSTAVSMAERKAREAYCSIDALKEAGNLEALYALMHAVHRDVDAALKDILGG